MSSGTLCSQAPGVKCFSFILHDSVVLINAVLINLCGVFTCVFVSYCSPLCHEEVAPVERPR